MRSCSGGKVAPIPPDVTRQILQMSRFSILPQGLASRCPSGWLAPPPILTHSLSWQGHIFRGLPNRRRIPGPRRQPQRLDAPMGYPGARVLRGHSRGRATAVDFPTTIDGSQRGRGLHVPMSAKECRRSSRPAASSSGRLTRSEPRKFEVIAYSRRRAQPDGARRDGRSGPPLATVRLPLSQPGEPEEFVHQPPERVPEEESASWWT